MPYLISHKLSSSEFCQEIIFATKNAIFGAFAGFEPAVMSKHTNWSRQPASQCLKPSTRKPKIMQNMPKSTLDEPAEALTCD